MSPQPATPPATVIPLTDAINTQPAGIVSRVLLKQKNGNVTLFAFDAGQELSEHTAPFDAMVYVLDGEVTITIGGTPQRVSAGSMIVMPANIPHALHALAPMKMLLVMIRD